MTSCQTNRGSIMNPSPDPKTRLRRPRWFQFCSAVVVAALLIVPSNGQTDTHYVSKTGSNTYPYDSWATAADTVARAVQAASEWDTILIAPGHYVSDTIVMKKGQVLKGAGEDATILDTLPQGVLRPVRADDSTVIEDIAFVGVVSSAAIAAGDYESAFAVGLVVEGNTDQAVSVRRCHFQNVSGAFKSFFTNWQGSGRTCVVDSCTFQVFTEAVSGFAAALEVSNCDFRWDRTAGSGAIFLDVGRLLVANCRFWGHDPLTGEYGTHAIRTSLVDPLIIRNCFFYSTNAGAALELNDDGILTPIGTGIVENNTFVRGYGHLIAGQPGLIFRNNLSTWSATSVIINMENALSTYNITWDNTPWDSGYIRLRDTIPNDQPGNSDNRNLFPMFVDTLDCLLQAYSPAIDAGDPAILDPDGSRSDIGYTGGPGGFTYAYPDLPPAVPRGLSAAASDTSVTLSWRGNHEADFDRYELYRDTASIVMADPARLLATIQMDSSFGDTAVAGDQTYYYRLRGVDAQENASDLSGELTVLVVGLQEDPSLPASFTLHRNYPNPFNADTRFAVDVTEPGLLTVRVYDVCGRVVATPIHATVRPGRHDMSWSPASSASGVYFLVAEMCGEKEVMKILLLK